MTIKTTLHYYRFDLSDDNQDLEYMSLINKLKSEGRSLFDSHANMGKEGREYREKIASYNKKIIELETEYIFNNQWNTVEGLRVFDWAESIYPNKNIKEGYYLELNDEIRYIRENNTRCHYCGKMSEITEVKSFNLNTEPDEDFKNEEYHKAKEPRCPKCKRGGYLINLKNPAGAFEFLRKEDIGL